MIPAMPASAAVTHQSAHAVLRFGRFAAMGAVAVLILIAGVWASWGTAQHVMLTKGRERGTVEVTRVAAPVEGGSGEVGRGAEGPDLHGGREARQ
jgi:fatty acid desaturase